MKPRIVVEGVVGAGKTTFINCVSRWLKLEPFYELTDQKLVDILENFYKDPQRWGFQLQIYFLTKRFQQMKLACKKGNVIMDRSIHCDHIFPNVLLKRGEMDALEYSIYKELHDELIELVPYPELMIYLKCSVEVAIDRIKKRGRQWELEIDENYWQTMNEEYESFFANYDSSALLVIDTEKVDKSFSGLDLVIKDILQKVKNGEIDQRIIYHNNARCE